MGILEAADMLSYSQPSGSGGKLSRQRLAIFLQGCKARLLTAVSKGLRRLPGLPGAFPGGSLR